MTEILEQVLDIHLVVNAVTTANTLSGGDRIFIEFARRWSEYGHKVTIYTNEEGYELFQKQKLDNVSYIIWSLGHARVGKMGLGISYLYGCLRGISYVLSTGLKPSKDGTPHLVFSSSDFWPDSLPGLVMKLRNRHAVWIASFFLFAPNPFRGFHERGRIRLPGWRELIYFLSQRPIYWIIRRYADMVFVTSAPDVAPFVTERRDHDGVVVVQGGVDVQSARVFLLSGEKPEKRYDACFVGRFHPQKGVVELVDIWERVCRKHPYARLAMIGNGRLEKQVRTRIQKRGLGDRIDLLGFMDGAEKYEVFKASRVILHPAIYDSGGMAACEGMAWGLPAVGFDLRAHKTYYARGMLKAPIGDLEGFAELIRRLLEDPVQYECVRAEAIEWANGWAWDQRASEVMECILSVLEKRQR